jgi:uncharacterized RDD family membrane protein YckC
LRHGAPPGHSHNKETQCTAQNAEAKFRTRRHSARRAAKRFRFVAYLIDGVISGIAFVILLIPLFVLTGAGAAISRIGSGEDISDDVAAFLGIGFIFGFFGIIFLVSWLYYALSESSSWQATPGKKMLNLKVTDMTGEPISFARASGRFFARIITHMIPLAIGYILAGFTEKKQAIHDMIASCLVLRKV